MLVVSDSVLEVHFDPFLVPWDGTPIRGHEVLRSLVAVVIERNTKDSRDIVLCLFSYGKLEARVVGLAHFWPLHLKKVSDP